MAWQRGEVWLDLEPLWLQDQSSGSAASLALNAPSFFGLPRPAPSGRIATGLAASKRRRAELMQRRNARRTRAAALVIGPAVMLSLATPKLGGARAEGILDEDPPSQTLRLGVGGLVARDVEPETPRRPRPPRPVTESAARAATAKPKTYPAIRWRHATSHGLPYAGSLHDGTQLPVEGRDWVTWNPVTDSSPNEPWRLYGNDRTIRRVVSVLAAYRAAHPDAPRVVVGDISFRGGGLMNEHRSHQNGLDVDVYYPREDRALRAPASPSQIDRALAQDLLDRFVAAGARMVFVGFSTGLRGPGGIVIPYPSHDNHMHVRFSG